MTIHAGGERCDLDGKLRQRRGVAFGELADEALVETDEAFAYRRAKAGFASLSQRGECCTFEQFKNRFNLGHLCARSAGADKIAREAWQDLITHIEGPTLFNLRDLPHAA